MTKKELLINAAYDSFYKFGFTATGVDKIIKDAGISKKTLYAYFDSKDKLIEEVIDCYFKNYQNFIEGELAKNKFEDKEKALFIFDLVKKWVKKNKHNGCLVTNAIDELNTENHADILKSCYKFKKFEKELILNLLTKAKSKHLEETSFSFMLLIEGAINTSKVFGYDKAFDSAKRTAKELL